MQFLTPLFGLGMLAIAVPVFLHLVRREKTKRIPFASLMFIRKIPIKELRRRRLTHLFLLLLRCMGLILLAAAFARPVVSGWWVTQMNPLVARSVVVLVDRSLSMSQQASWESALAAAEEIIQSLTADDEATIIQFGQTAEVLTPWEKSVPRLREILATQVKPTHESTSYVEGLRLAVEQLADAGNGKKEIHLVTDLQQTGMASAGWRMPTGVSLQIRDVSVETLNIFVEEARVEREVFTDQYPHPILVRLRGNPDASLEGEAQLFIEGQMVDRQDFQLEEQGTANLTFKPFDMEEGVSRGRVVLDNSDALAEDNVYYFVVERQKPRRILVLGNQVQVDSYLESALSSGQNLPFVVESVSAPGPAKIDPVDTPLVVLDDLPRPPSRSAYESYLEEGGGLILALSNRVRADDYNRQWGELLPVELRERNFVRGRNRPFTSITEVQWEHPIFTVFRDAHKAGLGSTQFYSYWKMEAKPEATVLARFNEGDPVLVEGLVGNGKVLVFSSSLDPVWTDFPLQSSYVPFWYRVAQYAAGWQTTPASRQINQVLPVQESVAASGPGSTGSWNVIDPHGQRVLALNQEQPDFIQFKLPGHYEVRSNKKTDWVAVNCPPVESDLTQVSPEEFRAVFASNESRVAQASAGVQAGDQEEPQQPLWWLFFAAAAVVLLAESSLANRQGSRIQL